jgi:hypothetical protein
MIRIALETISCKHTEIHACIQESCLYMDGKTNMCVHMHVAIHTCTFPKKKPLCSPLQMGSLHSLCAIYMPKKYTHMRVHVKKYSHKTGKTLTHRSFSGALRFLCVMSLASGMFNQSSFDKSPSSAIDHVCVCVCV